jgi:hypothetical protein
MTCPTCGKHSPPDPETGYNGGDYCSAECEEKDECDECFHTRSHHGKDGCEYEADHWVSGINCDGLVAWRCPCKSFKQIEVHLDAGDL